MFDLNETINWKPKSTGEGRFGNWIKMIGTYPVQGIGDSVAIWRTEDKQEEILVGSVEELYNEIEKSIAAGVQRILSKVLKWEYGRQQL
jgi:isoleucyl-tRNA synthetase